MAPTAIPNKQLYNGGSEWQNDYSNLPDYYQTFNRNYDAAIGRFVGVDPQAEGAESMTTYQYAGNNPIMLNDPIGDLADAVVNGVYQQYNGSNDFNDWLNSAPGGAGAAAAYDGSGSKGDNSAYWNTVLSAASDILQSINTNKSAFGYDFEDPDALLYLALENPGDYNLSVNDGALTLTSIVNEASAANAGAGNLAIGSNGSTQYLASTSNESFMEMNADQRGYGEFFGQKAVSGDLYDVSMEKIENQSVATIVGQDAPYKLLAKYGVKQLDSHHWSFWAYAYYIGPDVEGLFFNASLSLSKDGATWLGQDINTDGETTPVLLPQGWTYIGSAGIYFNNIQNSSGTFLGNFGINVHVSVGADSGIGNSWGTGYLNFTIPITTK